MSATQGGPADLMLVIVEPDALDTLLRGRWQPRTGVHFFARGDGSFTELSPGGLTLEIDRAANDDVYGADVPAGRILAGGIRPPEAVAGFVRRLARHVPGAAA
jgi:hypothetical protein